jgi:universal stress protein family protein
MRIRKVVVAVNHTPAAVHALREGALIASAAGAELVALTVVPDPWQHVAPSDVNIPRRSRGTSPADLAERRVLAELEALVAATIGPGWGTSAVQFGLPGIELARWSEHAGADLLVLGREPWGEPARRPAGRVVSGTLARSRVPCLLVPFGQRTWRRVVAALGVGPAVAVVEHAATAFAALWHAVPHCVHADPREAVRGVGRSVERANGSATLTRPETFASADIVNDVLKAVRDWRADTLVCGYHRGETAAEAGRVAPHLLERSPCAVLTVPV